MKFVPHTLVANTAPGRLKFFCLFLRDPDRQTCDWRPANDMREEAHLRETNKAEANPEEDSIQNEEEKEDEMTA
jgi:hypothetical protein